MLRRSRGGLAKAINQLALWLLFLTAIVFFAYQNISRIKRNYTDLHGRVHQLEYKMEKIYGQGSE